jgi:hypothetical protein
VQRSTETAAQEAEEVWQHADAVFDFGLEWAGGESVLLGFASHIRSNDLDTHSPFDTFAAECLFHTIAPFGAKA